MQEQQPQQQEQQQWEENLGAFGNGAPQCYTCGCYGHMSRECPLKGKGKGGQKGSRKGTRGKQNQQEMGKRTFEGECWNCGEKGHPAHKCPHPKKNTAATPSTVKGKGKGGKGKGNRTTIGAAMAGFNLGINLLQDNPSPVECAVTSAVTPPPRAIALQRPATRRHRGAI